MAATRPRYVKNIVSASLRSNVPSSHWHKIGGNAGGDMEQRAIDFYSIEPAQQLRVVAVKVTEAKKVKQSTS
jgi:hypothetical protein